jgi:Asp-tRNA(Asn)/Glu-tRNA(Gln) amidotransferase A subunit family amidase
LEPIRQHSNATRRERVLHDIAEAVRRREVTARELVERSLARIEKANPELNAVVARRDDDALAEADALDERVAAGKEVGPLPGVPFLVKDIEDLAGLPTTHGSVLFRGAPPAVGDGLVPRRLRAAGAIPVGKTNTPEFATDGFTDNLVFGASRNPWAPEWSPGGSSGGSAAAIASGMAPIATATDGAGSIRIPASFCGLVGIKPTNGIIGRDPIPPWIDLSTDGPMATSVGDLRLLLSVEMGAAAGDPSALPAWEPGPGGRPSRMLASPRFVPWGPLPPPVAAAFDAALEAVEELFGLSVEWLEPDDLFRAGNPDLDWFVIATTEHVGHLTRGLVVANLDRMHPTTRRFMEQGLSTSTEDYVSARRRRFEYVRELDDLLGEGAILMTPTVASEGWSADGTMPGANEPGLAPEVYNTAVQNLTGHPAISLPAGKLANGLPFGLQATAPRWRDDLLFDIAEMWERADPPPAAAPGYEPFWP